jgi:hypothetical protein
MAAVKLKLRGERPDASADWSIVRRIKLILIMASAFRRRLS